MPAEGGAISLNGGRLFLNAPHFALPGANFTGGSSVFGGTGRWSKDVIKTGEGTLRYNSAVDGVKLDVKEGGVSFNAADRSKIAGLYEGSYAYKKGTRPDYTDFFKSRNFPTNSIVAGTLCSYDSNYALWKFPDVDGGNTRAVIAYKGYLWNNSPEPVTWAFAGSEAATTYLEIGGKSVYEQVYRDDENIKHIGHGTATLQPGSNTFLYVVYAGGLTGGPNHWFSDGTPAADGNWKNDFGLAVNKSGIDSLLVDDYEPLMDPGDGSVYTYALPGQSDIVRPGVETPPSDLNGTLPTFDAMTFAAGTTVDFGGASSYRVETLEGAPAVDGVDKFSITSQWVMDVEDFAGGVKLTVPGSLELSGGLALTVKNARRFRSVAADGKLLIAEAPDGIALGETEMVSDMAGREFRLELSEDGKALYLAVKEKGLYLLVK